MHEAQIQAALAVEKVLAGATLGAALAAASADDPAAGRRPALVQELTYGTLRHWGTLEAIIRRLAAKPFADPLLRCLIAVALYQLDFMRAPPFAVVDRAVDAAALLVRPAVKPLVNAVLRRYLRDRETVRAALDDDPVARWSHQRWWIERVARDHPVDWARILEAGNARPPLALRVNPRVTTRDALLAAYLSAGVAATPAAATGIMIDPPRPVTQLPGYGDGAFFVQDLAAQLAAPLLRLDAGMRVLDACTAPGGKATHIAELADVELLALDNDAARLSRVEENLRRLKLDATHTTIACADADAPETWWDRRPFDRILADVPCSASGVVRRHPDVKWLRRESDVEQAVRRQASLLDALWPCLARGGLLLYSTCSVFAEENETQVETFVARRDDALRETLTYPDGFVHRGAQLLPSLPGAGHNHDGFFYALLRKA